MFSIWYVAGDLIELMQGLKLDGSIPMTSDDSDM